MWAVGIIPPRAYIPYNYPILLRHGSSFQSIYDTHFSFYVAVCSGVDVAVTSFVLMPHLMTRAVLGNFFINPLFPPPIMALSLSLKSNSANSRRGKAID